MKKKIFTSIFAIAIGLIASVKLYAQDKSWHIIVMDLNETEMSSFNTENSEILAPVNGKVDIINNWNNQNKRYSYDIATTLFKYELRDRGSATGTETITAEKWYVYYNGGSLYVSAATGSISIYSISGVLVGQYPNQSSISVSLSHGLYIVKSGNNVAKLLVNNSGYGGTATEMQMQTKSTSTFVDTPVALRSNISTYSNSENQIYWNIGTTPIPISDVKLFSFNPQNEVLITLNSGNSVELDYTGSTYDFDPAVTNSSWNLLETFSYGGVSLVYNALVGRKYDIVAIATTNSQIISKSLEGNISEKVSKTNIVQPNFFRGGLWYCHDLVNDIHILANYYPMTVGAYDWIASNYYNVAEVVSDGHRRTRADVFENNTPEIQSTVKLVAGNLVYQFVVDGETVSITLEP
jgi:hypothetical protein